MIVLVWIILGIAAWLAAWVGTFIFGFGLLWAAALLSLEALAFLEAARDLELTARNAPPVRRPGWGHGNDCGVPSNLWQDHDHAGDDRWRRELCPWWRHD